MRRYLLTLSALCIAVCTMAMSKSKIRTSARFLTDRMAYELDLTPRQYDDFYEINYDFLTEANLVMDDVMQGYRDAIYYYYLLLDRRNEDASYVLTYYQYSKFMAADYFYRPIYSTGHKWNLRVYATYNNHKFFYYDAPTHYKTYRGEHGRKYYSQGYYNGRYKGQDRYSERVRISGTQNFGRSLRNDFGVNLRDRNQDNRHNNYSNPNQAHRTQDERYHDVSGNRNSPLINQRNNGTRSNGSQGNSRGESRQPQTQPQSSTRTGRGNRTEPATTTTRSNSSTRTGSSSTRTENSRGGSTSRDKSGTVTRSGRR